MAIQKIQASAKSAKGFTLVELIVVITILVILGTIAFLNLGSFSAGARDSQRTSDLNQISTQISVTQAKSGLSYSTLVDNTTAGVGSGAYTDGKLGGTGTTSGTYTAGALNYGTIGIDSAKMKDPVSGTFYKIGQTSVAGGSYELAATLEDSNGGKAALVMGIYRSRTAAATQETATAFASGATTVSVPTPLKSSLRAGDWVVGGTSGTGQIDSVSSDFKTITLKSGSTASGATIALAAGEPNGLIASGGTVTQANAVTNKSSLYMPY